MTWMLTASGHPGIGAEAHALEEKLVAELRAVLSKPEYKTVSSWFRGMHTARTDMHQGPQISAEAGPELAVPPGDVVQAPKV